MTHLCLVLKTWARGSSGSLKTMVVGDHYINTTYYDWCLKDEAQDKIPTMGVIYLSYMLGCPYSLNMSLT